MPRRIRRSKKVGVRLDVTDHAKTDIKPIWHYVARYNGSAAGRLPGRFSHRFQILAGNPFAGRQGPDIGLGVRSLPVGNYVIFDTVHTDVLYITRVLHGARNLEDAYGEDPE